MRTLRTFGARLLCVALGFGLTISPALASYARARADYMIHCQGCHVPDGRGFPDKVPDMRTTLPLLLSVEGGRAFLVQVPGSAMSTLTNDRLAATLNWMVKNMTDEVTQSGFTDYTATEVEQMRAVRLDDVFTTRDALIGHLENEHGGSAE
jgi:mono/diheme cytochrome c family protein